MLTGEHVESHLRELGFGYRAKYIVETARVIAHQKPALWLESLRNPSRRGLQDGGRPEGPALTYKEAHAALLSLAGVGPKVADCVCLMGLGWGESVPVDTHVWQIAQRDYKFAGQKSKTFNKATYDAVGDHFRGIWGPYAGWAHSVLFAADLRQFALKKTEAAGQAAKRQASKVGIAVDASEGRKRRKIAHRESSVKLGGGKTDDEGLLVQKGTLAERRPTRRSTRSSVRREGLL